MHQFAKGVVVGKEDNKLLAEDVKKSQEVSLLKPVTLTGHTHCVNSVSLSSDGSLGLSGSLDKTLRLWDMRSGKCLQTLTGHTDTVCSVSLSSDGALGLSGSSDKTMRLWDIHSGKCLQTLTGHTDTVWSVSLSSDGALGLSGSWDKTLRLSNIKSGKCLQTLMGHTGIVWSVSLSSDSALGLSGSDDDTLRLWDMQSGKCLQTLSGHTGPVYSVSLSSDGSLGLSGSHDKTLQLWDIRSGKCLQTHIGHTDLVTKVLLTSDGSLGLSGSEDKTLRIWNLKSGKSEVFCNYKEYIYSLAIHILNHQLYALVGLKDGTLDYRHICALPQAKPIAAPLAPEVPAQPAKPILQLVQPQALFQPPVPAKKLLQEKQEKKETKEDAEIQITNSYKISYNSLKIGDRLGEGGFGIVYRGTWGHEDVAIKQIKLTEVSEAAREEFEAEVQVMAQLRSKYIVQFYGYCLSPQYALVMEYMPKRSLTSLLLNMKVDLDVDTRTRLMTEMACGLSVLHAKNILHRDIKSLNVLLDAHLQAKLSDFGLSKIKNETRTSTKSVGGTLQWMAPELLSLRPKHTKKSDIYSLGMTFWEIAARSLPYNGAAEAVIRNAVEKGEREQIPDDCPKHWATVIQACWDGDPNRRPDSDDIIAFFKSGKDDFKTFLPTFKATQANPNNLSPANINNLSSANPGASRMPGSPGIPGATVTPNANFPSTSANQSLGNSSFNRELMGNLASRR